MVGLGLEVAVSRGVQGELEAKKKKWTAGRADKMAKLAAMRAKLEG